MQQGRTYTNLFIETLGHSPTWVWSNSRSSCNLSTEIYGRSSWRGGPAFHKCDSCCISLWEWILEITCLKKICTTSCRLVNHAMKCANLSLLIITRVRETFIFPYNFTGFLDSASSCVYGGWQNRCRHLSSRWTGPWTGRRRQVWKIKSILLSLHFRSVCGNDLKRQSW